MNPFSEALLGKYSWQGTHKTKSTKCINTPENQEKQFLYAIILPKNVYFICICLNLNNKSALVQQPPPLRSLPSSRGRGHTQGLGIFGFAHAPNVRMT